MCLLVYSPAGKPPDDCLLNGLFENPDGWGYAYPKDGRLVINRGLRVDDFWDAWDAEPIGDAPVLWHARWATHGGRGRKQCHPFRLATQHGELCLGHNGIIPMPDHKKHSDTQQFVHRVLNPLRPGFQDSADVRHLLEHVIGWGKCVLLSGDGSAVILNERLGTWHEGIWYSNDGFRPRKRWAAAKAGTAKDTAVGWDDLEEPEWVHHYRPFSLQPYGGTVG